MKACCFINYRDRWWCYASQMKIRYPGNKISTWMTSKRRIWLSRESERKRPNLINQSTEEGFPSFGHGIDGFPNCWNPLCAINRWLISGPVGPLWCKEQRVPIGLHRSGLMMREIKASEGKNRGRRSPLPTGRSLFLQNRPLRKGFLENHLRLQSLANFQMKVNFKAGLEVQGLRLLAKQGPRWLGPFLHQSHLTWGVHFLSELKILFIISGRR